MGSFLRGGIGLILALGAGPGMAEPARFETPEAAVDALERALAAGDGAGVLRIFGPENEDVVSTGDPEEDRMLWGDFLRDMRTVSRIRPDGEGRATLLAGRDLWPFPVQLALADGTWRFDAEGARDEVLARRIGRNELAAIGIMHRAGEIQRAYRQTDHDGDGVLEFAASILSSPGERDGLYWPEEPGAAASPFDATMARASFTGYNEGGEDRDPDPLDGY